MKKIDKYKHMQVANAYPHSQARPDILWFIKPREPYAIAVCQKQEASHDLSIAIWTPNEIDNTTLHALATAFYKKYVNEMIRTNIDMKRWNYRTLSKVPEYLYVLGTGDDYVLETATLQIWYESLEEKLDTKAPPNARAYWEDYKRLLKRILDLEAAEMGLD